MGKAFHHVAIAGDHVCIVVDNREVFLIEAFGQHGFGNSHAYGIAATLTQRAGRGFDAGRVAVLGVAGCFAVELTEVFEVVHRDIVAGKMKKAVKEHAAMAGGKYEAVAIAPGGVLGVVVEVFEKKNN